MLRRRRRPARLPGRRRAGHDAGLRPSAGRRAVGLRHGPGRPDRDARAGGRDAADRRRSSPSSRERSTRSARRRRARAATPRRPGRADHRDPPRARCATRAPTPPSSCPSATAGRRCVARVRGRLPAALLLPDAGPAAGRRGGVGRGARRRRAPATTAGAAPQRRGAECAPCAGCRCSRAARGSTRRCIVRDDLRPGRRDRRARRSSPRTTRRRWSSPAGRPRSPRSTTWCSTGSRHAPDRQRDRHRRSTR